MLVERLPDKSFDHCLPADVQLVCGIVKFCEHGRRKIDIHSLNPTHHTATVREKT